MIERTEIMNKIQGIIYKFMICLSILFCVSYCSKTPETAEEIVARSLKAHGGGALSDWKSIIITGEAEIEDVVLKLRSEYKILAEKPDKVRMEIDQTKFERGRQLFAYIYNNGKGWMHRNLIPFYSPAYEKIHKRYYTHCFGIAYYSENASLFLKPEEKIEDKDVYVLGAVTDSDTSIISIDKNKFHFVREQYKDARGTVTRTYSEFKKIGKAVYPTKVLESIKGRTEREVEIKYNDIKFNLPIEAWMFEEDMPETKDSN